MNKKQTTWLALSLLLLGQAVGGTSVANAGFDLKDTVDTKGGSVGSGGSDGFGRQKFTLTSDLRAGYDDNPLAQPDTDFTFFNTVKKKNVTKHFSPNGSAFLNGDIGIAYTAANPRLTLSITADVGVSYYFDRQGRDYDVNGGLTLRGTYKATSRLFLEVTSFNSYISQGDYGATTLSGFSGGLSSGAAGIPGQTAGDLNGDYFYTSNSVAASYLVSSRISLVTSGSFIAFAYVDEPYSTDQDRTEYYISEELRYLVQPQLTLSAQYRFGYVDYFSVNNDSFTHFALAGVDYVFNPRLKGTVRAGAEFRSYYDDVVGADETSPYAEASLTYDLSRLAHLSFVGRYGIEEGDLTTDLTKSHTVRLGLNYDQRLTSRISAYVGFFYTHSYYQTPVRNDLATIAYAPVNFNEDTYDVSAGLRYSINRHFAVEAGYTHTTVSSELDQREYDRNRYFGGVRIQF